MSTSPALLKGLPSPKSAPERLGLSQMAGRLVELSGEHASANLSVAMGLVREAQQRGESAAWVTLRQSTFYPPDAAESGISLPHLAVVRVSSLHQAGRATLELTRSNGFDLVVLDLGPEAVLEKLARGATSTRSRPPRSRSARRSRVQLRAPLLTKLVGLARKNATAVVVLTEKTESAGSLSSLVSLRVTTRRDRETPHRLSLEVIKDKRRGPGRCLQEVRLAPAGLR